MRQPKPLLTIFLCLAILVSGMSAAVARAQMSSGHMVQICADGQAIAMMLDANGRPVAPQYSCPECLAATAGQPPEPLRLAEVRGRGVGLEVPAPTMINGRATPQATARGPPALI